MPFLIITWFFLPWVNHHQKVKRDRATSRSLPHPKLGIEWLENSSKACCCVFMTLSVLLVVTFSLLSFPCNELDDLWTKSVESLGWYNPVWDKLPLFSPGLETSCHMSQFDLEFHWTRPPSDKPVRAGWVLHDGEVGSLVRHTGQWLLTLRLTPRCSCGWKEIYIYIYIYINKYIYIMYIYILIFFLYRLIQEIEYGSFLLYSKFLLLMYVIYSGMYM